MRHITRVLLAAGLWAAAGCGGAGARRKSTPSCPPVAHKACPPCPGIQGNKVTPKIQGDSGSAFGPKGVSPVLGRLSGRQDGQGFRGAMTQITQQQILQVVQNLHLQGSVQPGGSGGAAFVILVQSPVGKVVIEPYGCKNGGCTSLNYYWGLQTHGKVTPDQINNFNRDVRFGRAYVDKDGDVAIEWDMDIEPGVNMKIVQSSLALFLGVVARFVGFLKPLLP